MSFFNLSDGSSAKDVGTSYAASTSLPPIPKNTVVTAVIDKVEWAEYGGERYVSVRWGVLKPSEYENRKLFQKVRVYNPKPETADKAKRMLGAICANAGAPGLKLLELGREPSAEELEIALSNKIMNLTLDVWTIKPEDGGEAKTGNWVRAVDPRGNAAPAAKPAPKPAIADEDIDFG